VRTHSQNATAACLRHQVLTLPFALLHRLNSDWLVPLITMLVAYPLISLDQIGVELQNPFAKSNLSHLPLGDISATIEKNVVGLLQGKQREEANGPLSAEGRMLLPAAQTP
jgi:predicted membrane chloride channel (bestrophin family)